MSKEKSGKTILLVEDEALIAMNEASLLGKYGYEVITAVKENDIDLGHGEMDGTETAQIILKEHDIPVVFLSSHTELEVVEKTEKITSYGYVVKSSSITILDASIKMAFKLFEATYSLKASENRYRDLYEKSPLGYQSLDDKGCFIESNPALCRLLGYEHDEIIGKWFGDVLTSEGIEIFKLNFPKFKAKGEISSVSFDMVAKDGSIFSVEIDGVRPYDLTHRIIRQDNGEERVVHAKGIVSFDEKGKPYRVMEKMN